MEYLLLVDDVPTRPLVRHAAYGSSAKERKGTRSGCWKIKTHADSKNWLCIFIWFIRFIGHVPKQNLFYLPLLFFLDVARQKNKRNGYCYPLRNQRSKPNSIAESNNKSSKNITTTTTTGREKVIDSKKTTASLPPNQAVASNKTSPHFRAVPRKEPLDIIVIPRTTTSSREGTSSTEEDTSISSSSSSELSFVSSSSSSTCSSPCPQQSSSQSFLSQDSSVLLTTRTNIGEAKLHKMKQEGTPSRYCASSTTTNATSSVELLPPRSTAKHRKYVLLSTSTTVSSTSSSSSFKSTY